VGETIAGCIGGNKTLCQNERSYSTIRGCATSDRDLSPDNGWFITSMQTYGF
jgi:hypothetical protein